MPARHPLDDQATLQLSDGADDDDNRPAQRTAGVDLFAEGDELDVQPVQLVQHIEEVLRGSSDPVTSPHQDDVELTPAGISHQGVESRPAGLSSGDHVGVLLDDLIATLLGHLVEVVHLGFRMLIEGADSHIKGGAFHKEILSDPVYI